MQLDNTVFHIAEDHQSVQNLRGAEQKVTDASKGSDGEDVPWAKFSALCWVLNSGKNPKFI